MKKKASSALDPRTVLFVGGGEAGDAWMAAALFSMVADPRRAQPILAAKVPSARVLSLAAEVLRESGCDTSGIVVREPTAALVRSADVVVTMGSSFRRKLLAATPHDRREHWLVPEAVGSSPVERVRYVCDLIRSRVAMLVLMEGWGRPDISREAARVTRRPRTVEALASL
jgi:protein-tyrosine-phosphatase